MRVAVTLTTTLVGGLLWFAAYGIFNVTKRHNQQEVTWKLFSQM